MNKDWKKKLKANSHIRYTCTAKELKEHDLIFGHCENLDIPLFAAEKILEEALSEQEEQHGMEMVEMAKEHKKELRRAIEEAFNEGTSVNAIRISEDMVVQSREVADEILGDLFKKFNCEENKK